MKRSIDTGKWAQGATLYVDGVKVFELPPDNKWHHMVLISDGQDDSVEQESV